MQLRSRPVQDELARVELRLVPGLVVELRDRSGGRARTHGMDTHVHVHRVVASCSRSLVCTVLEPRVSPAICGPFLVVAVYGAALSLSVIRYFIQKRRVGTERVRRLSGSARRARWAARRRAEFSRTRPRSQRTGRRRRSLSGSWRMRGQPRRRPLRSPRSGPPRPRRAAPPRNRWPLRLRLLATGGP